VPTLTANIFAPAINRTNETKQDRLDRPLSRLPKCRLYDREVTDIYFNQIAISVENVNDAVDTESIDKI
jgi:hypothetical protein